MRSPETPAPVRHEVRPGRLAAPRCWWLSDDGLHWTAGGRAGHLPLSAIATIRLRLSPDGAQRPSVCVLTERSGRRHRITDAHWPRRSEGGAPAAGPRRRGDSFRALVGALARRLADEVPAARLLQGAGWGEWIGTAVVTAASLAILVAGVWLMWREGRVSWAALAFLGVVALNLPLLWPVLRAGGPRPLGRATLDSHGCG
ncbi:hypothetical protein [Roseicyclus persicicus]|uniref:BURP domain-containing protein n=1 Tax=Roseicyclus persicicus TaxID=2650661 RepID=A0A7X6GZS4_9RHOB|nr:hypothetical protein [Roseibacterium persicicum]NKX45348.1 hypothetical protein [Roseibacterium persicicum]